MLHLQPTLAHPRSSRPFLQHLWALPWMGSSEMFKMEPSALLISPLEVKNEHGAKHIGLKSHGSASQYKATQLRTQLAAQMAERGSGKKTKKKLKKATASAIGKSAPERQAKILLPLWLAGVAAPRGRPQNICATSRRQHPLDFRRETAAPMSRHVLLKVCRNPSVPQPSRSRST